MLEQSDMEVIVDAVKGVVDRLLGERLEQVYAALEEIRDQTYASITMLDGNDNALLGEIRKVQHATPAEVLAMAGASWERWIRSEASALGYSTLRWEGEIISPPDHPADSAPIAKKKVVK